MQRSNFHDGSFVLHKVHLSGYKGHFSVWVTKDRMVMDAEQRFCTMTSRVVKVGGPAWFKLQDLVRGPSIPPA